MNYKFNTIFI